MDFNTIEESIRNYWKEISVQEKIKYNRRVCPKWEFLDGPPFVNGSPHHGHLLVSTIKDTMARYMSQKGYQINYQIGFDCHGLPLEQEAEKVVGKVGANHSKERLKLFNNTCRSIIENSSEIWYDVLGKLGRQFDKKETYYTSDFNYMKSLWAAFKTLWDKHLIYCSKKVMPYSAACETPISNFEANQNYKERTDISIFIRFKVSNSFLLEKSKSEYLLVWTTTPWSLFANQGICVNPELSYSLVEYDNNNYWISTSCIERVFAPTTYIVNRICLGKELTHIKYKPIFGICNKPGLIYRVYTDKFVEDSTGTGIVHLAPLFGEDDMRVMKANGYTMNMLPDIVDSEVKFNFDYRINNKNIGGQFVMDTTLDIVIELKQNGHCIKSEKVKHNYPYCWRTDTPLVYLATDAWFLNVQELIPNILENTSKINWYPSHVGKERFSNWIRSAPDWCISRNRTWGTPIPIWSSSSGKQICIGDVDELSKLTGKTITDLHLDYIYNLTFTLDGETYSRTFGVLDCWFESGMAPFARKNGNKQPVDFISESIDQTRGWFYTLNVLSTALYNQPAFKKVIVSGLILAEDGKKMSKRLKNFSNPTDLIDKFGSDIFRLYLLSSPACKAESFCFKDKDLIDIQKKLIPYTNAFNLFHESRKVFIEPVLPIFHSSNKLDLWIYNTFHSFRNFVYQHMENLELSNIPSSIYKFIDQLCNTYIKLSRERLKSQSSYIDAQESLTTLRYVLENTNLLLVPFAPHLSEYFHQQLINSNHLECSNNVNYSSIHLKTIDIELREEPSLTIIQSIDSLIELLETVRTLRIKLNKSNIYPLDILEIYTGSTSILEFMDVIQKELNIKKVKIYDYSDLPFIYKPNRVVLGKQFKLKSSEYATMIESGNINFPLCKSEYYTIEYLPKPKLGFIESKFDYMNESSNKKQNTVVYLSNVITQENIYEAHLNHIRRQINLIRKHLHLKLVDKILIRIKHNDILNFIDIKQLSLQLGTTIEIVETLSHFYHEIKTLNNEFGTIVFDLEKL